MAEHGEVLVAEQAVKLQAFELDQLEEPEALGDEDE